jgi:macrolide-specific efflux system membrane fusion protein
MRLFLTLLVVAGIGVGGFFVWRQWQRKQVDSPDAKPVSTANVEARDISFSITAAGEIGPADQVSVRPEINGKIAELPVDIGDHVKKGQLLCRLDDTDLQTEKETQESQIAGARLQIEAAALQVEKTEREFKRNELLLNSKLVAQEIFDNARTDFNVAKNSLALAKNSLERAEKALKQVEDKLAKTRIEAPFDCTVLTRPVSLGQTVSGSAGFNSGTEILTVANLNDMIITAHINQADVTRMKAGQPAEVQVESVPGLKMKGAVERIAPQAIIKNGIKGFSARIAIKNLDPRIRPGMTSILSIPVASVENALSVPLSAVFTEKGERFVYVKDGDKFERRVVQIGISDYSFAEVQRGLQDGEAVALELPANVKPVKPIKPSRQAGKNLSGKNGVGAADAAPPATSGQSGGKKAVL